MATISGTSGIDILEVTGTDFGLAGGKGNDYLIGADSDDGLDGGKGNDFLFGGDGNDNLTGGEGNDIMSGGDGEDVFVFGKKSGKDIIDDFDVDNDVLQIASSKHIKNVADVIKNSKFKNGDVEINLGGGNKIILKNVSKADFKADPEGHIVIT
jgi:Ca2+-binding RTX toxin-like protein